MDFTPDDDEQAIIDAVDRIGADFDDDYWSRCDQEHHFPWDFYHVMAKAGWVGIAIPEEYGGGGRGITEAAVVLKRGRGAAARR